MNFLVILDPRAGELEKILSGIKTMVVKDLDPARSACQSVKPGDSLYFLRDEDDCTLRVKANVVRVLIKPCSLEEDLPQTLKEMQPKLQLTESQYNYWSIKQQVLLIEFDGAHKIDRIHIGSNISIDGSDWIAFEELSLIL